MTYFSNVLVYRMGGSSADVSVLQVSSGVYQTLGSTNTSKVSGNAFTEKLMDYFATEFQRYFFFWFEPAIVITMHLVLRRYFPDILKYSLQNFLRITYICFLAVAVVCRALYLCSSFCVGNTFLKMRNVSCVLVVVGHVQMIIWTLEILHRKYSRKYISSVHHKLLYSVLHMYRIRLKRIAMESVISMYIFISVC